MNEDIKREVIEEFKQQFNNIYFGEKLPQLNINNALYFVESALNKYENKLFAKRVKNNE